MILGGGSAFPQPMVICAIPLAGTWVLSALSTGPASRMADLELMPVLEPAVFGWKN